MGSIFSFLCAHPPIPPPPLLALSLSFLSALCLSPTDRPPSTQAFPTRMIMLLSTAWCIQFTRLFSVISVNWILSITYRCFHICIKVRVVKSVKLQFRQCHSNKYTAFSLSLSPPSLYRSLPLFRPLPALQRWPFTVSAWILIDLHLWDMQCLIYM